MGAAANKSINMLVCERGPRQDANAVSGSMAWKCLGTPALYDMLGRAKDKMAVKLREGELQPNMGPTSHFVFVLPCNVITATLVSISNSDRDIRLLSGEHSGSGHQQPRPLPLQHPPPPRRPISTLITASVRPH